MTYLLYFNDLLTPNFNISNQIVAHTSFMPAITNSKCSSLSKVKFLIPAMAREFGSSPAVSGFSSLLSSWLCNTYRFLFDFWCPYLVPGSLEWFFFFLHLRFHTVYKSWGRGKESICINVYYVPITPRHFTHVRSFNCHTAPWSVFYYTTSHTRNRSP